MRDSIKNKVDYYEPEDGFDENIAPVNQRNFLVFFQHECILPLNQHTGRVPYLLLTHIWVLGGQREGFKSRGPPVIIYLWVFGFLGT